MSMILVTREVSRAVTKCDQDEGKSVFCGGVNLYYQRPMLSTILVFKHATVAWLGPCAITGHSTQTSCLIMLQVCLRKSVLVIFALTMLDYQRIFIVFASNVLMCACVGIRKSRPSNDRSIE